MSKSRVIVVHHHLFKNAGTSLDKTLKNNFGARWVTREFQPSQEITFRDWFVQESTAVVFSSHTAPIVPVRVNGAVVIQCVMIRHPLDRIHSAYTFEAKQEADTDGARFARSHDFSEYVEYRLAKPADFQCRNFHVRRLASLTAETMPAASELQRAMAALHLLGFVGIVEEYDESMRRLGDLLRPHFSEFEATPVRANVSRGVGRSLPMKLKKIRELVGEATYGKLVEANADDLRLYRRARENFVDAVLPTS